MNSVKLGEDGMTDDNRYCLLIGCNHCGFWFGWVSSRKKGRPLPPNRVIDTICSVCYSRVRFTRGSLTMKGTPIGSGAHHKSKSVFSWKPWNNPSTCKSQAAKINRKLKLAKRDLAERFGNRLNPHEFTTVDRCKD